ncbi:MAG: putative nucleic acid-binding Zn-ribbon protein [Rhodothermales bacterium]|jgi:predicted  nucleic acid-binding Zn-ribbon protein
MIDIQILMRLQEIDIVLSEARIMHEGEEDTSELRDERDVLNEKVDAVILARYQRLIQRDVAVVHVRGGLCTGCYLAIPQGDLNRMRSNKLDPVCDNCGRFLHLDS